MKNKILLFFLMMTYLGAMFAAQINIQFNNEKSGVSIVNEKSSGIVLNWTVSEMTISDFKNKNGNFTSVSANGLIGTGETGYPELLYSGKIIAVPVNAVLSVNLIKTHSTIVDLKEKGFHQVINPAQPSVEKSADVKDMPFTLNQTAYQLENYRHYTPVQIEEIGFMRGYRLVTVSYTPLDYNPVKNTIKVYDKVQVEITYEGADYAQTEYLREKTYSPAFEATMGKSILNYTTPNTRDTLTRYPMKYVIIADPMFTAQLEPFIEWKKQQGFQVITRYLGDTAVGTSKESIKSYLQGLWNAATPSDPAPTYLLFVGDHGQIPAWDAQASTTGHITDLTYVRLEGTDFLPEMYYGRFSANNTTELQPQIDKTLYYEKYQFTDPSYLGTQILTAGVDSNYGPTHANGQINYISTHYATSTNGVTPLIHLYPGSGSQDGAIVAEASQGVGWINYTAHGSATSWGDPTFTISNINNLQNNGKYPFVIGNCCLTNKFEVTTCFGEAWLRAENKGAIVYIGGTNSTYWNEDYWFAVGLAGTATGTAPAYNPNQLGMYDQAYHTHGEAYANWNISAMGMVHAGNMVVQASSSSLKQYYWEIYSVMGDPSLVPYLKQGSQNPVQYLNTLLTGMTTYTISNAAPYSYAAITFNNELKGYALCNENGEAVINLEPITEPGNAKLVISAQNYIPVIADIQVVPNNGAYIVFSNMTINTSGNNFLDYNSSSAMTININNVGSQAAQNLNLKVRSLNPYISLIDSTETLSVIQAQQTASLTNAFSVRAADNCPDTEQALMQLIASDSQGHSWTSNFRITINAPEISTGTMSINDSQGNNNGRLDPGETVILSIPVQNTGHTISENGYINFVSTNPLVLINESSTEMNPLAVNQMMTLNLSITASAQLQAGSSSNIGIFTRFGQIVNQSTFLLPVGLKMESFETGNFSAYPWTNTSTTPWQVVNTDAVDGIYTAKSTNATHNSTSYISVTDNSSASGVIKFSYKVSSEEDYDKLKFYIDGVEKNVWSGEIPWAVAEYSITAGTHTYKWEYTKDYSVSNGSDCVWIDKIIFPNSGSGNSDAPLAYVTSSDLNYTESGQVLRIQIVNFGSLDLSGQIVFPQGFMCGINNQTEMNYTIPAFNHLNIPVVFTPSGSQTYNGQIQISTNDSNHPMFLINVSSGNHFVPVWSDNGYQHMNFYVLNPQINGIPMDIGDEIAIFDGQFCVGSKKITSSSETIYDLLTSLDDPTTTQVDGYAVGHAISYRLWKNSTQTEYADGQINITYISGNNTFAIGATVQVSLSVQSGYSQQIPLSTGWNLISFNTLNDNLQFESVMQGLISNGHLVKVMNESGQSFEYINTLNQWINEIGSVSETEGYLIKVNENSTLSLSGMPVSLPLTIPLLSGWNMMTYPYAYSQNALSYIQPLITNNQLVKVMNESGQAIEYIPAIGWIDNIQYFNQGEGYAIKVNQNTNFICPENSTASYQLEKEMYYKHPACKETNLVLQASCLQKKNNDKKEAGCTEQNAASRMLVVQNNACSTEDNRYFAKNWSGNGFKHHNFYIPINDYLRDILRTGDEIAIFDREYCVAVSTVKGEEEYISLIASKSESESEQHNGFIAGNVFTLRIYTNQTEYKNIPFELISGSSVFEPGASTVLHINHLLANGDITKPKITILEGNFPNPFNPSTRISFSLKEKSHVNMDIFNIKGQLVKQLINDDMKEGKYHVIWDGRDHNNKIVSSGVYFYRMHTSHYTDTRKMLLIK